MSNPKISQIKIGKTTYDIEPASGSTGAATDATVTLSEDLLTYTPIGMAKTVNSKGELGGTITIDNTHPGTLGVKGENLRTVFTRLFGTQLDVDPSVTRPSLTVAQTGTTSVSANVLGTSFSSVNATVTFTYSNTASCTYGYRVNNTKTTGTQSIVYPITKQQNAEIKITMPSDITITSDMVTAGKYVSHSSSTNTLYCKFNDSRQVQLSFTLPAGYLQESSQTRCGTIKGEVIFASATTTNNTAITSFLTMHGNDADISLVGGTKTDTTTKYTAPAGYVPYAWGLFANTPSALPSKTSQYKPSTISVSGGSGATHLYILVPASAGASISATSSGFDVPLELVSNSKTYDFANDESAIYKVYRTSGSVSSGTFSIS